MSSNDGAHNGQTELIGRLLTDSSFRAAFRRDPAEACRVRGLHELADVLTGGGPMHTLELRESKSSLAGLIMALAAEGIGFGELAGLAGHGLHGAASHPAASFARAADVKLPAAPAPGRLPATSGATHGVAMADGGSSTAAASHLSGSGNASSAADATSAADSGAGAHQASAGVTDLLANPRLSVPPQMRGELLDGSVDPRVVSVLQDVVAHHTIAVGDLHAVTDPVHAQALDVVSVDGQPVGPSNVAARDLLTEIAALDPSVRPNQIGSPWPIQASGFFSDPSQQGRIRLAFVSTESVPVDSSASGAQTASTVTGGTSSLAESTTPAQPHVAAASDLASSQDVSNQSSGAYVSPLPADAQIGRTDMGVDVDLRPGEPIVAIGDSRVLGIMSDWYRGQPYVALQLLNGPLKGHNYYVAEQIDPAVVSGEIVRSGQVIAHYAGYGTGIEIGWAGPNWEQTLAQAQGNTGDASHNDSPAGLSFHSFLQSLRHSDGAGDQAAQTTSTAGVAADQPAQTTFTAGDTSGQSSSVGTSLAEDGNHSQAAPQPSVKPISAVFTDQHHQRRRAFQRQTIKFRSPSVQSAGQQPSGQPRPEPRVPEQPATHAAAEVADVSSGVTSVSSRLLTTGQEQFAARLAQLTRLDARVISAWALAEESGAAAQVRQAEGNFDWLNIGYFDSGPGQIAFDAAFKDPVTAAEQTARFLQGTWGGASSSIRAILATAGQNPQQQIEAIASSDWASSHYGNGANLRATYDDLSDIQIVRT